VAGDDRAGAEAGDAVQGPQPFLQAAVASFGMYWCTPL
jgi:hypothetical protein